MSQHGNKKRSCTGKRILFAVFAMLLLSSCGQSKTGENMGNVVPAISEAGENDSTISEPISEPISEQSNPLEKKIYEPLQIILENDDFSAFFTSLCDEYSGFVVEFSDYLVKHSSDIEIDEKGFADFDDYEDSLDGYYRFLNGVVKADDTDVPEKYQIAWSYFKSVIEQNKSDLDSLYPLKGQRLISKASDMLDAITEGTQSVTAAMPPESPSASAIEIGEQFSNDFMEIVFSEVSISDILAPSDTSRSYSYYDSAEGSKFLCFSGTIKNIWTDSFVPGNSLARFIVDDKYTYNARVYIEQNNRLSNHNGLNPFATNRLIIATDIPEELLDQYSTVKLQWGFTDAFSSTGDGEYTYVFSWDDTTDLIQCIYSQER